MDGHDEDRIHKAEPMNAQAKMVHSPFWGFISVHILDRTQEMYSRRSDTKRSTPCDFD